MNRNLRVAKAFYNENEEDVNMTASNNIFLRGVARETGEDLVTTENGAFAYRDTRGVMNTTDSHLSPVLDFFSLGGAARMRDESDIIAMFERAYAADPLRTVKMVFYFGNIRPQGTSGLGERRTFKILIKHLANNYPDTMRRNLHLVAEFNRWDSYYQFIGTPLEADWVELLKNQLQADLESANPSLLAKWIKSPTNKAPETKRLGRWTAYALFPELATTKSGMNLAEKKLRYILRDLRERLKVTERLMSSKRFSEISYGKVPSKAALIYNKAFMKRDHERYIKYLQELALGKAKVNAATLYPHELVHKVFEGESRDLFQKILINAMWQSQPNYIPEDCNTSGIVVADVSGSMHGTPMEVAIGLGMYMAERLNGPFKDHFITFSNRPQLVQLEGEDFVERVNNMRRADWDYNTDVVAVFKLILYTAVKYNLSQHEIPGYLYIISDMQFDEADSRASDRRKEALFQSIKRMFDEAGYKLPRLVFWNVRAEHNQSTMTTDDNGWMSCSGYSPSLFKSLMDGKFLEIIEKTEEEKRETGQAPDAIELMKFVLDSEAYSVITL